MSGAVADFARDGFLGPIQLLRPDDCRAIMIRLAREDDPAAHWAKGNFSPWLLGQIAANARLMALLPAILGDNVILWGASLVRRAPEMLHPWHVDIESAAPGGRFVTAWIGLENTTRESGIRLIAGSHRCKTIQQVRAEKHVSRDEQSSVSAESWASEEDPETRLVQPDVKDGDAILFDGRMWHGSFNASKEIRTALLLQFAAADSPVRIPDGLDWPFRFLADPLPPVALIHGKADGRVNRVIGAAPPQQAAMPVLPSSIRRLQLPLAEQPGGGWRRYPLLRGSTAAVDSMSCHAAVLSPGFSPHPPHAHADEELLILLSGEADLLVADRPSYEGARPLHVTAGDFAYYPPGQHHTIRNAGDAPVTYMMFRWRTGGGASAAERLGATLFRAPAPAEPRQGQGFAIARVLSAPTRWLRKLNCHMSRLEPGAGYAPHADPYDVAIIVRSGRIFTLGREVGPGGVIYCSAGELHGMRNIGDEPAHYMVFEFHGRALSNPVAPPTAEVVRDRREAQALVSPAA